MEFTVSSAALLKGILDVSKAIPVKTALPILENFLFVLKGDSLELTASDQELTLRTVVTVDSTTRNQRPAMLSLRLMPIILRLAAS